MYMYTYLYIQYIYIYIYIPVLANGGFKLVQMCARSHRHGMGNALPETPRCQQAQDVFEQGDPSKPALRMSVIKNRNAFFCNKNVFTKHGQ